MKSLLTFILLTIIWSCNKKNNTISIRKLPLEVKHFYENGKSDISLYYTIATKANSVNKEISNLTDSIACNLKDTLIDKYFAVSIVFLKESEITKRIKDNSISDATNPFCPPNFCLAEYVWQNKIFNRVWCNNRKTEFNNNPCRN